MYPPGSPASPCLLYDLRSENLWQPLGLDERKPRFSWKIADMRIGAGQTAYEIIVSSDITEKGARGSAWSSGKVRSNESHLILYSGKTLRPHTRYYWQVRIWDFQGKVSEWSPQSWWETGFLGTRWPALWINVPSKNRSRSSPARYLRKEFKLTSQPKAARLYVSALGLFEGRLNGVPVGKDRLAPGWTDYDHRVEYLTYDVSPLLVKGQNALSLVVGDGWYAGFLNWEGRRAHYGKDPAVLASLHVVFEDGKSFWMGTGASWKSLPGPVLEADLYHGETYDARKELKGWSEVGFDDSAFPRVKVIKLSRRSITGKATPPIRAADELVPESVSETSNGHFVFDVGQNIVGVARLVIREKRGTRLRMRYGEMLNADGTLYTANLRSAKATDYYFCAGGVEEIYEPRFTFHGFRYVELSGCTSRPPKSAITGIVLHSDLKASGSFSCSDQLVNKLQSNIRWGQLGNFLDVPTDCPQRDERLGWTGDAQVFIPTAAFNYDVATFFRKWLQDLRDGQHPNGEYPDVAPDTLCLDSRKSPSRWLKCRNKGNAAWADAGVICPWEIYRRFGDKRVLEENYEAMAKWVGFQQRTSRKLIRPDTLYGDWLAVDAVTPQRAPTPCDLIGTAYFARTTDLMARIASVLAKDSDAVRYRSLHAQIIEAFNNEFVTPEGRIAGDTQTGYLLALGFELLPEALIPKALDRLVWLIDRNQNRLATGFVGTPLLCPVLSRFNRNDVAYRLLLERGYPSWLYPVVNGATTMWERWNSWTSDRGFGEVSMNSFNHYAYGAIGDWLYTRVGGIDLDLTAHSDRHLLLRPRPGGGLTRASASLETPYGLASSSWAFRGKTWHWNVIVPPNLCARAELPLSTSGGTQVNRVLLQHASGVTVSDHDAGTLKILLKPGSYQFVVPAFKKVPV